MTQEFTIESFKVGDLVQISFEGLQQLSSTETTDLGWRRGVITLERRNDYVKFFENQIIGKVKLISKDGEFCRIQHKPLDKLDIEFLGVCYRVPVFLIKPV